MKYLKIAPVDIIPLTEEKVFSTAWGDIQGYPGDYVVVNPNGEQYPIKAEVFLETYRPYEEVRKAPVKDLGITEVRGAKANISDLVVYGDGDTFRLLCKASSQSGGWMKSTKVCNVPGGAIVQVTTQQMNPDGSYAVAEALTYVPGVHIDINSEPRRLVSIR